MEQQEQYALANGTVLIDTYRIDATISEKGGTAYLYLATDIRTGQRIALKECFPKGYAVRDGQRVQFTGNAEEQKIFRQAREMFVAETMLMRSLRGEGITPEIYDVLYENGTVYYAMEFLDGINLREYLGTRGGMDPEVAFQLAAPVFKTLMRLHEKNILHRDVSPDNIFICRDNSIRLIDFGNARVQETGKSRVLDWAKKGYAPIEQQNASYRQGTWTDVYALAATLYRMITGEVPQAAGKRVVQDELKKPSAFVPRIDPTKERALWKALAVMPQDRFATIRAFYEALYPDGETKPLRTASQASVTEHADGAQTTEAVAVEPAGWMLGIEGAYKGMEIPVRNGLMLGRASTCDVRFRPDTPGVSGVHLRVVFHAGTGRFFITDVGSTYGTRLLSGKQIERGREIALNEGEGFILGDNQVFAFFIKPAGI